MLFFRHWRQVGPAAIMLLLVAELIADLAHDLIPNLAGQVRMHLLLDFLQIAATLAILAVAARRVRRALRRQRRQSRHYARLTELGHEALRETDAAKMYRRCLTLLVDVLECDAVAYVTCDEQGGGWETAATAGRFAAMLPKNSHASWGASHFGDYVMHTTAQPVYVKSLAHEQRFIISGDVSNMFASGLAIRIHFEAHAYGIVVAFFRDPTIYDTHSASYLRGVGALLTRYLYAHQSASALKQSEALFQQLAEHIEDVFYVANADGSKVHYVSPAYEKIWQASASALYQNADAWLDPIHEEDRDKTDQLMKGHALGNGAECTYRIVHGDGTVRWISERSFPIHDQDGITTRVAGLCTDITDIRRAQEMASQLALSSERNARTKAETHIRTRDEVLAIVSHDLRSPLSSVSLAAQRLAKHCKGDDKSVQLAGKIEHAVERMEHLVQDLLDVSRLEAGVLRLERRNTTLADFWQEATEAYETHGDKASVVFARIDVQACGLSLDAMRILQVLGNLIGNAVHFTPAGGTVTVSAARNQEGVHFSVKDNGPGMSEEQSEHLFEPFWQGSRHDNRGLGLGLHIAKGIVEGHGGVIGAHSTPLHGTVVWFSLPVAMAEAETEASKIHETPAMRANIN